MYEGEMRRSIPCGFIRAIYGDGRLFFGHMHGMKKEGYGELYSIDGDLIECGVYKNGKLYNVMMDGELKYNHPW